MTSHRLFFNTASMYFRFLISMAVAFLLTPYIILKLGSSDFGLWTLVFSILGFFELADLGFGTAITKYVAECAGTADHERRNRITSSVAVVYLAIAALLGAGIWILSLFLETWFTLPPEDVAKAHTVLFLLGARVFLFGIPLGLFRSILFGQQWITSINAVASLSQLAYGLGGALILYRGGDLVDLAIANLVACGLEHAAYVVWAWRNTPEFRLSPKLVDTRLLKETATFSIYQSVINVSALILLRTDPIIIGIFLPLSTVAVYAVALRISTYAHLIVKQLINVLTPHIAYLKGKKAWEEIRNVFIRGTRLSLVPAFILGNSLIIYGKSFIIFWVGVDFQDAGLVLTLLTGSMVLGVPELMAANVLAMTDHFRFTARSSIGAAILNVALSITLIQHYGIVGVAAATLISKFVVDYAFVMQKACRETRTPWKQLMKEGILAPLLTAIPHALCLAAAFTIRPPESILEILLACTLGAGLYLGLFWIFCTSDEERDWLYGLAGQRKRLPSQD